MPSNSALIEVTLSDFRIISTTEKFLAITSKSREELIGKDIFESFPSNPIFYNSLGEDSLLTSFKDCVRKKRKSKIKNQRYDTTNASGEALERYWNIENEPIIEDDKVKYIIHTVDDVTNSLTNRKDLSDLKKDKILEITSKTMTESNAEIKKSAQKLRSFVESAPFPIGIYIGREMRIELANQAILDVWGRKDVVGKLYSEVLPELESQLIYPQLDQVYLTGKPYHAKNQKIDLKHNGELKSFYFNYNFTPLFDDDGSVYGVMNTAADVTDTMTALQKVEENETRYRTLIENSSVATALYRGIDLKIQYANDIMLQYWGKDDSIIGKPLYEGVPELKSQEFLALMKNVYETGKEYIGIEEKAFLLIDGVLTESYFDFSYKPLFDNNGKPYGIHHMAVDVTKQVLIKQELEKSENKFRSMVQQAPVAICVFQGENYIFDVVNVMMEEMLGKKSSFLKGKPFFDAMPEMANDGLKPILDNIMKLGHSYKSEEQKFVLPRGDNFETIYASYIYEPIKDASGKVHSIIVVAADTTPQVMARRKIEEIVSERTKALADANKSLKQSNAELEQFAYIASHDLQEPLRKISIFGKMLEESLENISEKSSVYMSKINNSTQRMSNLIKDVLGYSQLSKDNEIFKKIDLNKSLKGVISDYELIIEQKGASIHWTQLPVIEVIPLQISQLLSNLISNSIKYSRKEIAPEITITTENINSEELGLLALPNKTLDYIKIVYTDNGIGFKQEYADKIFNIFQRLHGKTDYEGTGIGLAMCKKIVQNHQGIIYAEGNDNFGAKFIIVLPVKQKISKS